MRENHDYLRTDADSSFRLRADILTLMLKGAGYAAAACLAIWLTLALIMQIGRMLPDESRETEDPTPFSLILSPAEVAEV